MNKTSVSHARWHKIYREIKERIIYWENELIRLTGENGEAILRGDMELASVYDKQMQGAIMNLKRYNEVVLDAEQQRLKT